MAFANDIRQFERNLLAPVHAMVGRLRDARARRRLYLQTYDELSSLNERDLADIGISRSDIPELARKQAMLG